MKFKELAQYIEQIEKTASRLTITHLLSDLYKKLNPQEIEKTAYLLQGRVAPLFEKLEFSMAEKSIIKTVASALSIEKKLFETKYKKIGDLGMTVEFFKKEIKLFDEKDLTILEVYENLLSLAKTSGIGSQEKKLHILAGLIRQLDPLSTRYLVRIPTGVLRLGFSDMTVLDAFSWMIHGDKSLRPVIEQAYHVRPDLGFIGKTLKEKGIEGLKSTKPKVFTPIIMMRAERLSSGKEIIEKIGRCAIQQKFDGFRCITGYTPIYVKDKGYISVRDLKTGDFVLTHLGRFKKVLAINRRVIDRGEKIFRLQSYLGDPIKISEGHPILTWKNSRIDWKPVEQIKEGDEIVFSKPKLKEFSKEGFINSPFILKDESGYKKTITIDKNFYRFLGFWVGDGFTNDYHNTERVGLVFNAKTERVLAEEYKSIIHSTFGIDSITHSERNGAIILYWRDKPLRLWLSRYFRREWRGKMIPPWFSSISKDNFQTFLKGWVESDGSSTGNGGYKIITKERDLAALTQLIALHHGIPIGIHKFRQHVKKTNFTGTYYALILPGTKKYIRVENNYIFVRVLHNELIKRDPRLVLYNLQIEDDESYCSGLVTLHNCQIHKSKDEVKVFSRNLEEVSYMYPDIIEGVKKEITADEIIFEGEAIGFDPQTGNFLPFQETVQRKRKYNIEEKAKEIPLKLFAFELLFCNGIDYIRTPYRERRVILEKSIVATGKKVENTILIAPEKHIDNEKDIEIAFQDAISKGLEGIVAKKLDGIYQPGARGWNWIKFKRSYSSKIEDTIDCLVMGYDYGKGKRTSFGIGAFLVGIFDEKQDMFLTIAKIGTGLSDEEWKELKIKAQKSKIKEKPNQYSVDKQMYVDVWVQASIVVEIRADEISRSPVHTAGRILKKSKSGSAFEVDAPGFALRFPRLERFRDDKQPQEVTTLKELEHMFKKQGIKKD